MKVLELLNVVVKRQGRLDEAEEVEQLLQESLADRKYSCHRRAWPLQPRRMRSRTHGNRPSQPKDCELNEAGHASNLGPVSRQLATVLLIISAAALLGCNVQPPSDDTVFLIDEEPGGILRREHFLASEAVFEWDFRSNTIPAGSLGFGSDLVHRPGHGLVMHGPTSVNWENTFDASSLTSVRVDIHGRKAVGATIQWRSPHEGFSGHRQVQILLGEGYLSRNRQLNFDLSRHPLWLGKIAEMRLSFELREGEQRLLEAIHGLDSNIDFDLLSKHTERPLRVLIDGSSRAALIQSPRKPIARTLELPRGGTLQFALGAIVVRPTDVTFTVEIERDGKTEPIYEETFLEETGRSWEERRVELPASEQLTLILESHLTDESGALPVWGTPEIVPYDQQSNRPSIVLVSVDTLRADRLSAYGYEDENSPNIDRWASRDATLFETVVAPAPWTLPSHASMLSGIEAPTHGVNYTFSTLPGRLLMLAQILRSDGYATAAVTGGAFLNPRYGFDRGFDRFETWKTIGEPRGELESRFDRATDLLRTLPRPFFLFIHTFSVHDYPIYRRRAAKTGDPLGDLSSSEWYDRRVRATDQVIGSFLAELETNAHLSDLAVFLTSDHGESLSESGQQGHGYLTDDNLLVPLIVELPGVAGGGRIDRQVRSIDIPATIIDVAGLQAELDGVSLLPLMTGAKDNDVPDTAFSYAAKRNLGLALREADRWKFVLDNSAIAPTDRGRVYDLRKSPHDLGREIRDHPRLSEWQGQAERLLSGIPGALVTFSNRSSGTLYFRIEGEPISAEGVKSVTADCGCIRELRPGNLLIELPPNLQLMLKFEEHAQNSVHIEAWSGRVDDPAETSFELVLGPNEASRSLVRTETGWELSRSAISSSASGLEFRWVGKFYPSADRVFVESDGKLRQQLEELGYLQPIE